MSLCCHQDTFWIDGNEDWRCAVCGKVIPYRKEKVKPYAEEEKENRI